MYMYESAMKNIPDSQESYMNQICGTIGCVAHSLVPPGRPWARGIRLDNNIHVHVTAHECVKSVYLRENRTEAPLDLAFHYALQNHTELPQCYSTSTPRQSKPKLEDLIQIKFLLRSHTKTV